MREGVHVEVGVERAVDLAMAGGSPRHNRLSARVIAQLDGALSDGPCGVYALDQKIELPGDAFMYPDVTVGADQRRVRRVTASARPTAPR